MLHPLLRDDPRLRPPSPTRRSSDPGLAKAAIAIRVDGALRDLGAAISGDADIAIITRKSDEALELIRHDTAHVMAEAVQELYPGTQVTIGPADRKSHV